MVDSRQKGARAETAAKDILKKYTKLNWQRVPLSGALSAEHGTKGDIYIPQMPNVYSVEVKHYKDDQISTKLLTGKSPIFDQWWEQAELQAKKTDKIPLLIFKHDRSKFFVATRYISSNVSYNYLYYSKKRLYISLLETWLINEKPEFLRSLHGV